MLATDLAQVERIGERVHPHYPEDAAILAERQRLYPQGCFMLERDAVQAYAVSHPWRLFQPPKLNTKLHRIPDDPDTFYIHDIAILPEARRAGAGAAIVRLLAAHATAAQFPSMSLVAVAGSVPFWTRHGFQIEPCDALASYGDEARFMVRPLLR